MKIIYLLAIALLISGCATAPTTIYKTQTVSVPTPTRCSMTLPPAPLRPLTESKTPEEPSVLLLVQAAVTEIRELDLYITSLHNALPACVDIIK
jgi:hypothetical protein